MAELFLRHVPGYPRYTLSFDSRRGEIVVTHREGGKEERVYLDGPLVEAIQKYAEDARL